MHRSALLLLPLLLICSPAARGQIVLTNGSTYTQDFNTLSNTAGSTTNNLTIPGWFMTESGGGARDNEQYAVDDGTSGTGDTYSYGTTGSVERALGALRSGTLIPIFGANFANMTGSTITDLIIAYIGEEWRLGTAGRTDQINFEYSLNATDLVTGTWNPVAQLNFVTPDIATVGAKNGNAAGERTAISFTITGLNIPDASTFWIRWTDTDVSGADDGLAVDDFSLAAVPEPSTLLLVSLGAVALLGRVRRFRRSEKRARAPGAGLIVMHKLLRIRLSRISPAGRHGRRAPVRAKEWAWERIEVRALR